MLQNHWEAIERYAWLEKEFQGQRIVYLEVFTYVLAHEW